MNPTSDLIRRILANAEGLDPDLRLRGMPPPMQNQPQTPNPGLEALTQNGLPPMPSMQQTLPDPTVDTREPFLNKLRRGVTVPTTPIRHKNVNSRSFLRGLVGGFKQSGEPGTGGDPGGGRSGGSARAARDYSTAYDAERALAEQRRARAAEIGEPDAVKVANPLDDELLRAKIESYQALRDQRLAAAARNRRPAAVGSGRGAGGARKGTSPYTSDKADFGGTADMMRSGIIDSALESGLEKNDPAVLRDLEAVDVWEAQQMRDLGRIESDRRRGTERVPSASGMAPQAAAPAGTKKSKEDILRDMRGGK